MYGLNGSCQLGNGTSTGTTAVVEILTDVNGNPFYGVTEVSGGWGPVSSVPFYAALESDTCTGAWFWGNLTNVNGGSTCAKPTFIPFAAGKHGHHIIAYNSSTHVTMTDGSVYVIGGTDDNAANTGVNATPTTWTHLTGMNAIAYVAKGNGFGMAVTTTGDTVYAWGQLGWVPKGLSSPTFTLLTSPTLMNAFLSACLPVDTLVAAHTAWMAKKKDGTLWGAGSNEVGLLGIGPTINWNTYQSSGVNQFWNWDTGMGEFVTGLTQVAKGKSNFMTVFGGALYSFYFIAEDSTGHLFTAGRNKSAGDLTGVIPADTAGTRIAAAWHVSWNLNILAPVFPDSLTSHANQIVANNPGYEWGLFTGTPGSFGTDAPNRPNTNLHANLVLTPTVSGFGWNGNPSTTDASHKIMFPYCYISQASGTSINLGVMGGKNGTVLCPPGTYGITYTVIDNSWDTVTTTLSVTVPTATQTGFYFSAAGSGSACTVGAPCPPAYFNTSYAAGAAGDTFYLKRGDVFPIQIVANASGATGNPIVTKPYGTGNLPVIGGRTVLTGWANVSGNVWQVAYSGPAPTILQHGEAMIGQTMLPDLAGGWFATTSSTLTTLTDATHAALVRIGSKVIIRSSPFTIDTALVTNVTGSVITFSPAATYSGVGGGSWKIMNGTPYEPGQWQDTLSQLRVFSVGAPTGTWTIPTVDTPLLSEGVYQKWDSLRFQGGNSANIILAFQAVSNNQFTNDSVTDGFDGFQFRSEGAVTVNNVVIRHMSDNGVLKQNTNNYNNVFSNMTLFDIGLLPGMGHTGNGSQYYSGIVAGDSGSTVTQCLIDSVGYIGVANYGSGFTVDSNVIVNFCQTLEDGAAVYTWMTTGTLARQRKILNDICINGGSVYSHLGLTTDFSSAAMGVYLDNFTNNVLVQRCGVLNVNSCAFYDHGANNTFNFCVALNAGYAGFLASEITGGPTITGLSLKNSVLGLNPATPYSVRLNTVNNDLSTFGTLDSNYYLVAYGVTNSLYTFSSVDNPGTNRGFASWKTNTGYDSHTKYLNWPPLAFYYTATPGAVPITGFNRDVSLNLYTTGSITLPGYVATILQQLNLATISTTTGSQIKFQ